MIDALRQETVRGLAERLRREVQVSSYNPFNLLYGDGRETFVTSLREDGVSTEALDPGAHVLCNRDIDDPRVPKVARIQRVLQGLDPLAPFSRTFEALSGILRSHGTPETPLDGVCVHAPAQSYGTRSSAIWALGRERNRLWYADGSPCEAKLRNYTALLDELQPR